MTTNNSSPTIWRLHIRPKGGEWGNVDLMLQAKQAVALCRDRSVLGMGWPVHAYPGEELSWTEYQDRFEDENNRNVDGNVRRWKEDVKIGDLVWTRTTNAEYLLARVTGERRYETDLEFVRADMVNIREVEFVFIGNESHVPGKVVNSFIPGRTLQRVNGVDNLSRYLWNKYSPPTSFKYEYIDADKYEYIDADIDLFDILSFQDAEDVVYIMFQLRGYLCAPTRRLPNAMAYEYLMWSRDGTCKLAVQVKTGNALATADNFPTDVTKIVLFSTTGNYAPTQDPRVTCLDPDEVISFIGSHLDVLPQAIADGYRLWQILQDL